MGLKEGDVVLDKYRIEEPLGSGGMGLVVAARHLVLDERVAIKVLRGEFVDNDELVGRFIREAKAAVRIRSEHVVRVSDVGRLASGEPFMVMELLEGRDLADVLYTDGPLPLPVAVDYLLQAGEAVAAAHAIGIIHRDLKPANMFLTTDVDGAPFVKVLDFGISKFLQMGAVTSLSRTQGVVGSPLYMSPEQISSSLDIDARTDVWAMGVALFELLTKAMPFGGGDLAQLVFQVLSGKPKTLTSLRPELPAELDRIMARCLAKNTSDRYPDIAGLARDLAPFGTLGAQRSSERIVAIGRLTPSTSLRAISSARMHTPVDPTSGTRISGTGHAVVTNSALEQALAARATVPKIINPVRETLAGSLVPSIRPPRAQASQPPPLAQRGALWALAGVAGTLLLVGVVWTQRGSGNPPPGPASQPQPLTSQLSAPAQASPGAPTPSGAPHAPPVPSSTSSASSASSSSEPTMPAGLDTAAAPSVLGPKPPHAGVVSSPRQPVKPYKPPRPPPSVTSAAPAPTTPSGPSLEIIPKR